jgi:hypothetical protein
MIKQNFLFEQFSFYTGLTIIQENYILFISVAVSILIIILLSSQAGKIFRQIGKHGTTGLAVLGAMDSGLNMYDRIKEYKEKQGSGSGSETDDSDNKKDEDKDKGKKPESQSENNNSEDNKPVSQNENNQSEDNKTTINNNEN